MSKKVTHHKPVVLLIQCKLIEKADCKKLNMKVDQEDLVDQATND